MEAVYEGPGARLSSEDNSLIIYLSFGPDGTAAGFTSIKNTASPLITITGIETGLSSNGQAGEGYLLKSHDHTLNFTASGV